MKNNKIFRTIIEIISIAGLLFHASLIFGVWNILPQTIPVHFGIEGQADAWGDKTSLLWFFGLNIVFYAGLTILERYPQKFNYPWQITENNAARQYNLAQNLIKMLKCEIVWLFAIISAMTVSVTFGLMTGVGNFFLFFVIAIAGITLITYMLRASRSAH